MGKSGSAPLQENEPVSAIHTGAGGNPFTIAVPASGTAAMYPQALCLQQPSDKWLSCPLGQSLPEVANVVTPLFCTWSGHIPSLSDVCTTWQSCEEVVKRR